MELCVGAVSRLVVEEAAKLGVAQVIASRRQVNADGGYTSLTQRELVELVHGLSAGQTAVIRDHGGPHQNGDPADDWDKELCQDVEAGFDGLHLDVSCLPKSAQLRELTRLTQTFSHYGNRDVRLQIGGERDSQHWLWALLSGVLATRVIPSHCVIALGGHAHADRQAGNLISPSEAREITECYHALGVRSVAHNMDFVPGRNRYEHFAVDAVNIAPEYGVIEMDAWLRAVPPGTAAELLKTGYDSQHWQRWFGLGEGTLFERSRCGLRYVWAEEQQHLRDLPWYPMAETYVRGVISSAIAAG